MYPLRAERPAKVVITEIIPFSTNNWTRKTVRFEIESVIFRNVEFPPSTFVNVIIGCNTITGIINYVPRQEQVFIYSGSLVPCNWHSFSGWRSTQLDRTPSPRYTFASSNSHAHTSSLSLSQSACLWTSMWLVVWVTWPKQIAADEWSYGFLTLWTRGEQG